MIDKINEKENSKSKKYLVFFKGVVFKDILLLVFIIGLGYLVIYQTDWLSVGKISNEIKDYKRATIEVEAENKKNTENISQLNIENENLKKEISAYLLAETDLSALKVAVENLFFEQKLIILTEDLFVTEENQWWKMLTMKVDLLFYEPAQVERLIKLLEENVSKKIRIKEIYYQTADRISLELEFYFF